MPTLEWIGKEKVINHHQEVPFRVLDRQYSFDENGQHAEEKVNCAEGAREAALGRNGSENMIIHGDNLDALKALLPRYEGRVKCIYIDPPYNTGNEGWVYNDNVNDPKIRKWLGEVVGKEGEDLTRHDKWLCMMYPRLKLLQKLLAEDGCLIISIGYHELNNLVNLLREIFGSKQIVTITVQTSGGKPSGGFNYVHEYLIFVVPIFAQDLLSVYEQQTEHRDALRAEGKKLAEEIAAGIHAGSYDNPVLENKLTELAGRLARTGGKKVYGYLKADVKDLIDNIVDELAKDERIASLYSLWYEKREEVLKTYTMDMPARLPLSRNPEFKPIRNAVIQAAMEIMADRVMEDGAADEGAELSGPEAFAEPERSESEPVEADIPFPTGGGSRRKKTWWTDKYKTARSYLYGTKDVPPNFKKAFEGMQEEAASGNGLAMYDLGRMHLSGLGCEKDEDAAQEWFAKAYQAFLAEEGRAKKPGYMQYRIGKLFSFGYGVEQDYLQAAAWYEKAVANENPFAAYALASLYRRGQGVEQDNAEAFRLYTMAASDENSPNAYAAYELGRMYKDGVGTTADKAASESWYRKAYLGFLSIERQMADDKLYYRLGQMNLTGTGTEKDLDLAREYFEKAAALDNADALYGLGKLYLDPRFAGCSAPRAVDYLFAAAQKGHDYGQYALGRLFLAGEVVPKNPAYALIWLEKAVKQENPAAEYLLGKALLLGEDAPQDLARGEALLNRAIENGHEYAAYVLGKAYLEGSAVAQDIPKAIGYLTMAAEKGAAPAEYALGKLFYQGEAVPKDVGKALYHLESAAEKDHPYAAYLAGKIRLSEEGYLDVEKAVRLFEAAAALGNDFAEYQLGKLYLYGKDVSQNMEAAVRWLTASAEHGNQYAAQLLHSVRNNKNLSVAMASLRLLHHISRMIQNRLEDERRGKGGTIIERKLRRQIEEKKQALGIRL